MHLAPDELGATALMKPSTMDLGQCFYADPGGDCLHIRQLVAHLSDEDDSMAPQLRVSRGMKYAFANVECHRLAIWLRRSFQEAASIILPPAVVDASYTTDPSKVVIRSLGPKRRIDEDIKHFIVDTSLRKNVLKTVRQPCVS